MKELALFAEVEYSRPLTEIPTAYQPGIWAYCLYTQGGVLPFMEDTYNRVPISVNSVIIDTEEYVMFDNVDRLRDYDTSKGCWAKINGGSVICIRYPFHKPPYLHYSFSSGILMGFTNGKPLLKDGVIYRPGVMTTPQITHSADAFTYDRMKFNTANISIDNTDGQFDDARALFGNEFNLKVGVVEEVVEETERRHDDFIKTIEEAGDEKAVSVKDTDEYIVLNKEEKEKPELKILAQYYIENISVTLDKAEFKLSDKRERLSAKIPNKQWSKEEFEYLNDNLDNKDMQEVYGHCFGVPGVCLEENRIYIDKSYTTSLPQYRFRFSSQISRIDRIQVKMTAGEIPNPKLDKTMMTVDGWTTIYQRIAPDETSLDCWKMTYPAWKKGVNYDPINDPAGNITDFLKEGIITLRWDIAKQGGDRKNRINEVRMDGVFNDPKNRLAENKFVTPRDIIEDILYKYSSIPYDNLRYNLDEFEDELKKLEGYEIGVMFDKSVSVYEAIEKLQGGSVMGFQFQVQGNRFTARVDDPKRKKRKESISHLEIININEVEVDWSADLYGTFTNIEYAYNYSEKTYQAVIDRERRQKILSIHRVDKEWNVKTLLANEKDAKERGDNILTDFEELRQIIRNIKLSGEKWLGLENKDDELRIYDIIDIDFSIKGDEIEKYPQYLIKLIEEVGEDKAVTVGDTDEYVIMSTDEKEAIGKRDFMKTLTCQILSITPDCVSGFVTIDVRVANIHKLFRLLCSV